MRDRATAGNLPVLQLQFKLETKDFLDFAHRQPLGRHSVPPRRESRRPYQQIVQRTLYSEGFRVRVHHSGLVVHSFQNLKKVDNIPSESLDNFLRNGWTTSIGTGG